MNRWTGRIALVTGANSGIGAAVAKSLSTNGMQVIGADLRIDMITSTTCGEKGSLTPYQCDLTVDENVESLFTYIEEKFGGIDICVNSAGVGENKSLIDGNPKRWRQLIDTNLIATAYCSKLSVDLMRKKNVDDGHIINIASIFGSKVSQQQAVTHFYSVTKFGVKAFTEGLRMELRDAKSKIKVTSICPGLVRTNIFENSNIPTATIEALFAKIPSIEPEDVADTILHAISTPANVQINDLIIFPTEQLL